MSDKDFLEMVEHLKLFLEPISRGLDDLKNTVEGLHKGLHKIEIQQVEMKTAFKLNRWLVGLFILQFVVMVIGAVKAY